MDTRALTIFRGLIPASREALLVCLVTAAFIALSIWWLLYDGRAPTGGDAGRHMSTVVVFVELLGELDFKSIVEFKGLSDFFYPPVAHLVGALPGVAGLRVHDWGPIALNVVFVPMLAAGCYLMASRVYGRRAGLLAAVFALGTPMVLQLSHTFMLDMPLTGIVALTAGTLIASDRFSRGRESAIAGVLMGLAMLVKPTAPLFVAGLIGVMIALGGWRSWRNIAGFAALTALIATPYFAVHADEFLQLSKEATVASEDPWTQGFGWTFDGLDRFSPESLAWYTWAAINVQLFLPLFVLFAIGLALSVRDVRRRRFLPEVLAGLGVGYLAMTFLSLHDPRYTLPLLGYVAVIATGWIAVSRHLAVRTGAVAFLLFAVALNVAAVSVGGIGSSRVTIANGDTQDLIRPGAFTLLDSRGWVTGEPDPNPVWEGILVAARAEGLMTEEFIQHEGLLNGTDPIGFDVMAYGFGIEGVWFRQEPVPRPDLRIHTWWFSPDEAIVRQGIPQPCGVVAEGEMTGGIDAQLVKVAVERRTKQGYRRWCPL